MNPFAASATCSRFQIAFKWSVNFWLQFLVKDEMENISMFKKTEPQKFYNELACVSTQVDARPCLSYFRYKSKTSFLLSSSPNCGWMVSFFQLYFKTRKITVHLDTAHWSSCMFSCKSTCMYVWSCSFVDGYLQQLFRLLQGQTKIIC